MGHIIMGRLANMLAAVDTSTSIYGREGTVVSQSRAKSPECYHCVSNNQDMADILTELYTNMNREKTILSPKETHIHRYCNLPSSL